MSQLLPLPTSAGAAAPITFAASPPPFNIAGITVVQNTGSDGNRVSIVFLGDGYTSGEISGAYHDHVEALASYLFTGGLLAEPFNRYHAFFNVYAANLVSNESGADNPATGTFVNTALNATYRGDGVTDRLLTIDWGLGDGALSQALGGTTIQAHIKFVTVNSSTYGGSGGSFAVYAGGNGSSLEVALHEMGHSFGFLADEYEAAGTGGAGGQRYSGPEPAAANVTASASGAKWAHWLGYNQEGIGVIGAYEGAQYYSLGLYRPSLSSKMRTNNAPFDAVAREQFILRIYEFVDPIDSATPGTNLTDPASLLVKVIDPAVIKVRWSIDDLVVSDGNVETFVIGNYDVPSGTHSISALAYDPTDWVRLDRSSLEQRVSWTVTVTHATLRADGTKPLVGGSLSDTLVASRAADSLSGGDGVDTLSYALSDAAVTIRLLSNSAAGGFAAGDSISGFENVTGSNFGDELVGSGGVNILDGGAGDDRLDGGAGADQLIGGKGNDIFFVDAGDSVVEAANGGIDEVRTGLAAYVLTAEIERLAGTSGTGQALTGNALANVITGGAGNDVLDGLGGADQLAGGLGNDFYIVDSGDVVTEMSTGGVDEVRTALAAYTLGANLENLTGTSASGQALTGNGLANVLFGGGGNDTLDGGASGDHLLGGAGNDIYFVDSGDAVGESADEGVDEIRTALAALTLSANFEKLTGTSANGQTLTGNGLANVIAGGSGNDVIDGGGGADQMAGGLGNDLYFVSDPGDTVVDTGGLDEIRTALPDSTAGAGIEGITGVLAIGQTLRGNALGNLVAGGAGADRMVGGLGDDTYMVGAGDNVLEKPGEGVDEVRTALAAYALTADVERLIGTSATGQALTGNALANLIAGGAGNDTIDGGAGVDQMEGGLGNDVYFVRDAGDSVTDTGGIDEIRTALSDTTAGAGIENITGILTVGQTLRGNGLGNVIAGGAGADRMVGGLGDDIYVVGAGDNVIEKANEGVDEVRTALAAYTLTAEVEKLTGTSAAGQALTGNALANVIAGGAGNDVIDGGAGVDQMAGGLGNDVYFVRDAGDSVADTGGIDEIRTALSDTTAGAGIENITGILAVGQTLRGNGLGNVIAGGRGADRMVGGLGDDVYLVAEGDNVIERTGEGADEVRTALASYTLTAEVEKLTGTSAAQALTGNALANVIAGGAGADVLTGGGGADVFRYQAATESYSVARDHITDFTPGTDRIELDRIDSNRNAGGDQAFSWIGSNAFSKTAGELRAFQSGSQWIVQGDINGDGFADLIIALTLQGPTPLGAGDFVL